VMAKRTPKTLEKKDKINE